MYLIKKIGKRTKQEQIRILRCFQEKNEKIFFPYKLPLLIQMNQKQIEELVKNTKEVVAEDYFDNICYLYDGIERNIEKKIEKILKQYIQQTASMQFDYIKNNLKDICLGKLGGLDARTISNVKEAICYEVLVNNYDRREFDIMKEKKVFESGICFDQEGKHIEGVKWWFSVESDEELWERLLFKNYGEGAIITDKSKPIERYSYALVYVETSEDYDLQVYTGSNHNFEQEIVPRIIQVDSNICKEIKRL